MSDDDIEDGGDSSWDEMSWEEASEFASDLDSDELVELLDSFEFSDGEFEFTIEMDNGELVTISVDLEDMYDLYDFLEESDWEFYMQYGEN